jgi:DICT domain-containing protein
MSRSLLLVVIMLGMSSCVPPESIDLSSFDPAYDQTAIAGYYKNQAIAMREKADAQVTAAARYEALFGSEADLVSGARSLARYYEQTAKELARLAEAHETVARTGKRPTPIH